jgi:hypothetical protein
MFEKRILSASLILLMATGAVQAQSAAGVRQEQPPIPVDEIIKKFSEKEKQFRTARGNYTYRQDVSVQELNANDRVLGEYRVVSDITFDQTGRRTERIVQAPPNTLQGIQLTPQDLQDIREIQPFVLTSDDIGKYELKYSGKEKIDEIDCYVFDVAPKKIEKGQRYFQGQIWVDDQDLQIVKTYGKAVPDIKEKERKTCFLVLRLTASKLISFGFPPTPGPWTHCSFRRAPNAFGRSSSTGTTKSLKLM